MFQSIMMGMKNAGMLPRLSDTERQALEAGDVWAEGEFFKGSDFETKGLYVIGTERAYSRRVDDQLIGRSGRQGAEGDSRFFLSLEDDVPRIFGGEKFEPLSPAIKWRTKRSN